MIYYTRREMAKFALAALPAGGLWSSVNAVVAAEPAAARIGQAGKPNSKFAGVQVGINVPYSFKDASMSADEILRTCIQLGISAVELRAQPIEVAMGAPAEIVMPPSDAASKAAAKTAEGEKKAIASASQLLAWRRAAPLAKAQAFRQQWESAGVLVEILKVDGIFKLADESLDYFFTLAKAVGARAISSEISFKDEELKRVGQFADKHQLLVAYHGHASTSPASWEKAFSLAKYNGANVDLGHFVAGNNFSPVDFITKYHGRISHVHIKDRKRQNGANLPFGEGDTPIAEVLRLIRDNRWRIQATIEFEYKIPANSDLMTEIARSVQYCRDALV